MQYHVDLWGCKVASCKSDWRVRLNKAGSPHLLKVSAPLLPVSSLAFSLKSESHAKAPHDRMTLKPPKRKRKAPST